MASHELKTPMTTIRGHVQLVLRKLAKQSEMPDDLTIIHTALEQIDAQTRRLNSLVDQLLDLENIRAGKVALRLQPCDLVSLCREVIEGQSLLTGRVIELHAPSTPLILQADCDRLVQVFVNLISNAIKYSPDESSVKVQVSKHNDVAVIQVIDNGPGIPKSQQAHIFKPFYRGPDVRSTPIDGLGLGLTICKDIVEQHRGHIWCYSREGEGSTFFVELPLY
jgi:signal transduction histidine kinase